MTNRSVESQETKVAIEKNKSKATYTILKNKYKDRDNSFLSPVRPTELLREEKGCLSDVGQKIA